MKNMLISLLLVFSSYSLAASEQEVAAFLKDLSGHYRLIEDRSSSALNCPQRIKVKTKIRELTLVNLDQTVDPDYPELNEKTFFNIGGTPKSADSIYRLVLDPAGGDYVVHESRNCPHNSWGKCGDWIWNSRVTKGNPDYLRVEVSDTAVERDNSGFPNGSCLYQKIRMRPVNSF